MMPELSYIWDQRLRGGAGSYRNKATGRIIPHGSVRGALDDYVDNSQDVPTQLYDLLSSRQISVADWQLQMRAHIKNVNMNAAISAVGGRDQMTQSAYGRVGQLIRRQYEYLDSFAAQISSGDIPIDKRILSRSKMYTEAAVDTHEQFVQRRMLDAGFDEQRSVLDQSPDVNHCTGSGSCTEQAARDFVPIGDLIPIGRRLCKTRDRCTMEYRNSGTGLEVR